MEIRREDQVRIMTVELRTGSFLLDLAEHIRSFQGSGFRYSDMIRICMEAAGGLYIMPDRDKRAPGPLFLQYKETDWEFIKRVASHAGAVVIPEDATPGKKLYLGWRSHSIKAEPEPDSCRMEQDYEAYRRKTALGIKNLRVSDFTGYDICTREIYGKEPDLVVDWLKLYRTPTVSSPGRSVPKPKDADNYDWGMEEELNYNGRGQDWFITNSPASKDIAINGGTLTAVMTENNLYADAEGRYWVAVGPNVIDPDHPTEKVDHSIPAEDMEYGTKMDIVVEDGNGDIYYIPAVVGDAKEHSYPDGLYQTGEPFDTNRKKVFSLNKNSVEFIGFNISSKVYEDGKKRSSINITNKFILKEIIVYDGVFNYE